MRDPNYLQQWFDTWDGPINVESPHGITVAVAREHVDLRFRATACLRRENGAWKITHVHNSVPFAMDGSGRALLDLEP